MVKYGDDGNTLTLNLPQPSLQNGVINFPDPLGATVNVSYGSGGPPINTFSTINLTNPTNQIVAGLGINNSVINMPSNTQRTTYNFPNTNLSNVTLALESGGDDNVFPNIVLTNSTNQITNPDSVYHNDSFLTIPINNQPTVYNLPNTS